MPDYTELEEELIGYDYESLCLIAIEQYDIDPDHYSDKNELIDAILAVEDNNRVK